MQFQLQYITPEIILAIGGMIVLFAGLTGRRFSTPGKLGVFSPEILTLVALVAALVPSVQLLMGSVAKGVLQFTDANGMGLMTVDGVACFFKVLALVSTIIVVLLSIDYFKGKPFHRGEYYALLIFATLAINFLAASTDMVMIYLSLEFLSLTSYVLVGYLKQNARSSEAAIKYFLYGSIAAAVMVYGMSVVYGLTAQTNIFAIAHYVQSNVLPYPVILLATIMILVGFGFKTAMVPFHQWSPDTYEGAPTPITAFLSVGSKAAGFAVLMRVLGTSLVVTSQFDWTWMVIILSAITMTVGNLIAIPQRNIKRMLAYSSIAHAGYLLLGIATIGVAALGGQDKALPLQAAGIQSVLLYLFVYMFMNLGAFAVVIMISNSLKSDELRDYAGLSKRAPGMALAMVFFLLSLAGLPPTAGFLGKFYLFFAAIQTSLQLGNIPLLALGIVAIINTIVSVYYYFNIIRLMYVQPVPDERPVVASGVIKLAVGITVIMTVIVLIFPQPFVDFAALSAKFLGI